MNREISIPGGAGVYPLTGDVLSQAGSQTVTVAALQGITIATPALQGGETLEYNVSTHNWFPTLRASIQVNNVTVSDDYLISVNASNVSVNGTVIA